MVMILLPPSEGKTVPQTKAVLDLSTLSFTELTELRSKTIGSLVKVSEGRVSAARKILGVTANQDAELERNHDLRSKPVAPALAVYTGVLFDAIGINSLSKSALKNFSRDAYVVSALFGLISVTDHIPAYRLSGSANLPRIGSLSSVWNSAVSELLDKADDFMIDLRSGVYQKLGQIPVDAAPRAVVPRILQKMPSGPPKLVSHHNKATKGRIVRAIAESDKSLKSVEALAEVVAALGADVEVISPSNPAKPFGLDVVVPVL
jgi:cytoplasmic iron level regulating protein YaaA (DUF328/UPF0246 family)